LFSVRQPLPPEAHRVEMKPAVLLRDAQRFCSLVCETARITIKNFCLSSVLIDPDAGGGSTIFPGRYNPLKRLRGCYTTPPTTHPLLGMFFHVQQFPMQNPQQIRKTGTTKFVLHLQQQNLAASKDVSQLFQLQFS
jgi:hypothetical protein